MDNKIAIYQTKNGALELNFDASEETIWATQAQIAELFDLDQSRISRHIAKIFADKEVAKSNMRKAHIANSDKPVNFYNLDVVLAVGYRADSTSKVIAFRQWASRILKSYLLHGVAVNQERLDQLHKILEITNRSEIAEVAGIADVVKNYVSALNWLEEYDEGKLPAVNGQAPSHQLTYQEARVVLNNLEFSKTNSNFALERSDNFKGIIATLYQTFDGQDLYPSLEEKAANLLYLVVKDHPFYDGNKRSAAALFVYFLAQNNALRNISNSTLTAITLMTALSKPEEKEVIVLLIMNFLTNQ